MPATELQIDRYLAAGAAQEGTLAVELAADDYALRWWHPYGSGQVGVAVTGQDELTMEATAGPSDGLQAPVTVTLTNVGCNPFSGTLSVEAETASGLFYGDQQPVGLELAASQTVTLTFGVENMGATGDQARLTFSLGELEDETQLRWLDPGQTGTLTYTFFLPPDLASGDYPAIYLLTGTLDPVQARLNLFSGWGGPVQVTLHLDEGPVTEQGTTLGAGCDVLTVTLAGRIPPGRRILTARLEMDGQRAVATTAFAYGTSLPDLHPGAPWVASGGTVTRTVRPW
jgi:hypothetical protein